jgi:hypothetical protein
LNTKAILKIVIIKVFVRIWCKTEISIAEPGRRSLVFDEFIKMLKSIENVCCRLNTLKQSRIQKALIRVILQVVTKK